MSTAFTTHDAPFVAPAPVSENVIAAIKAVVGDAGWSQDESRVDPKLTEWRGKWKGHTPLLVLPKTTEEVSKVLPNAAPMIQQLWVSILEQLGIPIDPKLLQSPEQMASQNPQLQLQILGNAQKNPQVVQALIEQDHQMRQMAFDAAEMQQGGPANVQASAAEGNGRPQTVPSQGF